MLGEAEEEEEEAAVVCVMWYFLSAMPQVDYSHPELSGRFKAARIQMMNLASQSQAAIMADHLFCALLTLQL